MRHCYDLKDIITMIHKMTFISYISVPVVVDGKTQMVKMDILSGSISQYDNHISHVINSMQRLGVNALLGDVISGSS